MTGIIILVSLVWVAGVVVCVAIIYRAGIEEGIRRANAGGES